MVLFSLMLIFASLLFLFFYTVVDILTQKSYSQRMKTNWLGVICLAPVVGSLAYLYSRKMMLQKSR